MPKTMLVTGAGGLIGSEVVEWFAGRGYKVVGVDNNMRADFFGPGGDVTWRLGDLTSRLREFSCRNLDIRDRAGVLALLKEVRPAAIIHAAAQPSHDLAASRPFDDFDVNAGGTLNLLEACRTHAPESPFVLLSTNKVYGDGPNAIPMKELATRWEYGDPEYLHGIPEHFSIDQSTHSVFGASKVAADVMVQEYGRYFGMPTVALRGGCLTGPNHSGVELHGFLSYLVRCNIEKKKYTVFGYKGKQVRDNIHSRDVAAFVEAFIEAPRVGEVYNLGGGKENSISILEAFSVAEEFSGEKMLWEYSGENRVGDHICYYTDLRKIQSHYPRWTLSMSVRATIEEIVTAWRARL